MFAEPLKLAAILDFLGVLDRDLRLALGSPLDSTRRNETNGVS